MPNKEKEIIILTGKELGEYINIAELRRKAVDYYKANIQGKIVVHPEIGEIQFTGIGLSELKHYEAKEYKPQAIPQLLDLVKTANCESKEIAVKENTKFKEYYKLNNSAKIDGNIVDFKIIIGVDRHGNKFYDLIQLKDDKDIAPEDSRRNQTPGTQELTINIPENEGNFNINQKE